MTGGRTVIKGHGTGNDFLLYADPDGTNPLTDDELVALADRHLGIGADGVIRAVRTEHVAEVAGQAGRAEWFMDYRNADGSTAKMCGNGLRVYVAYLEHTGLLELAVDDTVRIATRGGTRQVRKEDDGYAVEMGSWRAPGGAKALKDGFDATVAVTGLSEPRPGLRIGMPNPHTVVALADRDELAGLSLVESPRVEPEPPAGTNVEFVVLLGEREIDLIDDAGEVVGSERVGVVQMRVHERGVGETLSCGTGACAAAVATHQWFGDDPPTSWVVLVPGGQLRVSIGPGRKVELAGPVELVAEVSLL